MISHRFNLRRKVSYELRDMMYTPSEPVPELKPSKEQIARIARALYPIIFEHYYTQDEKDNG